LNQQHPIEGVAVNHRQRPELVGVGRCQGQLSKPRLFDEVDESSASRSLPSADLVATSATEAAET
jgi:hypothetical protein